MVVSPLKGWRKDDRLGKDEPGEGPRPQDLGHDQSRPARRVANTDEVGTGFDTLEDSNNIAPQIPPIEWEIRSAGVSVSSLIDRDRPRSIELLEQRNPSLLAEPVGMNQQKIGLVAGDLGGEGETVVTDDHIEWAPGCAGKADWIRRLFVRRTTTNVFSC